MAKDLAPEGFGVVYHVTAKRIVCVWGLLTSTFNVIMMKSTR
jgi:hypothetical protein